jgi:membrane protease subunit HflK
MQGDVFNYRRATSVSILGTVIQTVVTLLFAVYAAYSRGDHAAWTTTVYVGMGIPVWLTLVLLYDQHRRERIEAIEAERLASDPMGSAFEQSGDEMRVAARRLAGIQKFVLPIVSLSVASVLISVGFVRFGQGSALLNPDRYMETPYKGWAIAIGLAAAFVGFVFARFVSGMGKQRVWSSLRGGASYAVGAALLGLAIAVAHFVQMAGGGDGALRYLQVIFPAFLVAMGIEIVLNFVLDIYRPRVAGEDPRPAFDSRLLGLLAAPDKIAENIGEALNYQFGIEVSRTWFYLLVQRWWPALVGLALFIVWGMTSLVVIEPHQRALILRFGIVERANVEPGLHFKWPWPIGSVYIPTTAEVVDGRLVLTRTATGVREMNLGTNPPRDEDKPILWTEEHTLEEVYSLVQPTRFRVSVTENPAGGASGGRATGDENLATDLSLVAVEFPTQWIVDDVEKYDRFAQPEHREALLKAVGQRAAMQYVSALTIDDVLAGRRTEMATELRHRLEDEFGRVGGMPGASEGAGGDLLFVGARDRAPAEGRGAVLRARSSTRARCVRRRSRRRGSTRSRLLNSVAAPIERETGPRSPGGSSR